MLADPAKAAGLARTLDRFYEAQVRLDLEGPTARVDRIRLKALSRTEIAAKVGTDGIDLLALSCWVASRGRGNDFCKGKVDLPQIASN